MAIPKVKDIIELVKTGATIEAQEKIMEMRQAALDLQEENVKLRGRVRELEEQRATREKLVVREGNYYLTEAMPGYPDGPFCTTCFDTKKDLVVMKHLGDSYHPPWVCAACHPDASKPRAELAFA